MENKYFVLLKKQAVSLQIQTIDLLRRLEESVTDL